MMTSYEGPQHVVAAFWAKLGKPEYISSGAQGLDNPCQDLIFEIGSITKVFTAILLCHLIEEEKVDPCAPLSEMADELVDVPDWITPRALVSHSSGLPRLHVPIWRALIKPLPADPYSEFGRPDLLELTRTWRGKSRRPKHRHAYSNLGIGLLGEAMSMMEGKPFVDLLKEKVTGPIGLKDTTQHLNREQEDRFARPRRTNGTLTPPWTWDAMAGAGCLRSTVGDLARFSTHCLQALKEPSTILERAIQRSTKPILGLGLRGNTEPAAQCHGWFSVKANAEGPHILHHDGGTAGSTCAIYLCPERQQACAILANNGIAANLWTSAKLSWSNPTRQAYQLFVAS